MLRSPGPWNRGVGYPRVPGDWIAAPRCPGVGGQPTRRPPFRRVAQRGPAPHPSVRFPFAKVHPCRIEAFRTPLCPEDPSPARDRSEPSLRFGPPFATDPVAWNAGTCLQPRHSPGRLPREIFFAGRRSVEHQRPAGRLPRKEAGGQLHSREGTHHSPVCWNGPRDSFRDVSPDERKVPRPDVADPGLPGRKGAIFPGNERRIVPASDPRRSPLRKESGRSPMR